MSQEAQNFLISQYEFAGPFENNEDIKEASGLCVVLQDEKDEYNLLEIFCTDNALKESWRFDDLAKSRKNKNLRLAVHYQKSIYITKEALLPQAIVA